jgi:glycosyltransferase involved in cell wall biosynthesis
MEKPLTVIQTLPALHSGGVERGTLEIARALVAAGHRSIVVSNGGRMVEQLEREGSEHITLPVHRKSLMSLLQVKPFRTILEQLKPDIVHARSRVPAWIAWLALRRMNPATRPHFVTTVHGLYSVSPYSAIMTKGERVIAVSETVRQYILDNYPSCPANRIDLVYRGVDPQEFPYGYQPSEEWRHAWELHYPQLSGKKILTLPGRITRLKGHETFISLIGQLKAEGLAVHGVIVGGAEEKKQDYLAELHQLVARHNLADDITFTGLRNDIRDIFAVSDIVYSLSTKPETFGRTTLEALSQGTPVIGWNTGGVGEILSTMYPDGAIAVDAITALEQQTRSALDSPPLIDHNPVFTLAKMQQETLRLYAEICSTS